MDRREHPQSDPSGGAEPRRELAPAYSQPGALPLDLVVASGTQQGARARLTPEQPMTVGLRLDCDVVLETARLLSNPPWPQGAEPVIRLTRTDGDVTLEVLSGEIALAQSIFRQGDVLSLHPGTSLQIGDSIVQLELAGVVGEASADVEPDESRTAGRMNHGFRAAWPQKSLLLGGAVAGLALVAVGMSQSFSPVDKHSPATLMPIDISEQIQSAGFSDLRVNTDGDHDIQVTGFVGTRAELIELKSLVAPLGANASLDIQVGEELQEAVAALFRVHGVSAEVTVNEPGSVTVKTVAVEPELLESIEQRAHADVAALETLVLDNTPPEPVKDNATSTGPGKRIVSVVATEPAHILTEDGTRYFPGAVLPNGYKILQIRDQMVDLVRDDEHIELIF